MGRGHGKGKRGGRGGGGRRLFVSSLEELEARNTREADWQSRRAKSGDDDNEEEGEEVNEDTKSAEEGGEGGGSDDEGVAFERPAAAAAAKAEAEPAAAVPAPRKAKGTEGVIEVMNPNAIKAAAPKTMKAKDIDVNAEPQQLSRREREALEAERKKAHYDKLHAEGKTDEAKRDMERLAAVKARREAAAKAKAEAEADTKAEEDKVKGAAAAAGGGGGKGGGESFEHFGPIEIKKMNPTKLKELLKQRSLSLQGSKKDLQTRLIEWEGENS